MQVFQNRNYNYAGVRNKFNFHEKGKNENTVNGLLGRRNDEGLRGKNRCT